MAAPSPPLHWPPWPGALDLAHAGARERDEGKRKVEKGGECAVASCRAAPNLIVVGAMPTTNHGASPAACAREKQGRRRVKWSRVPRGATGRRGGCICETHGRPSDPDLRKWMALHGRATTGLNWPRWEAMAGRNGLPSSDSEPTQALGSSGLWSRSCCTPIWFSSPLAAPSSSWVSVYVPSGRSTRLHAHALDYGEGGRFTTKPTLVGHIHPNIIIFSQKLLGCVMINKTLL
jgi:hypothetical protein